MLRFWITVSLLLVMVFMGFGLVVSKAWGWSEYASDELYVIYYQTTVDGRSPLFLVNGNGTGEQWKLDTEAETLRQLNCSPDGQTLVFDTDQREFYTVRSTGIVYHGMFPDQQ